MSERVAGLLFKIRADTTSLREGMNSAKGAVDSLHGTVRGFGTGLMKLSGITLSIGAVFGTFKQILRSTELTSDSFDFAIATVKGTLQGFFSTIASGDFRNFISNMVSAAKATRDLKIATDDLTNAQASAGIRKGTLSQRVESARLAAAGTLDPAEKAKYLAEAISFQEQLNDINAQEALKAIKIREAYYVELMGLDKDYGVLFVENLRKIAANWEAFGETPTELFKGWQQRYDDLAYLMTVKKLTPVEQDELDKLKTALQLTKDYYELASLLPPDVWIQYAKDIGTYNTTIAEGDKSLRRMTQGLTTAEDKVNKLNTAIIKEIELIGALTTAGGAGIGLQSHKTYEGGGPKINELIGTPSTANWTNQVGIDIDALKENLDSAEAAYASFIESIKSMVSELANIVGNAIESAFAGASMEQIGADFLKSVGKFMQQIGSLFLSYGIAQTAFAEAIKDPTNEVSAGVLIAAGAALIAIGSAITGMATSWGNRQSSGGGGTFREPYTGTTVAWSPIKVTTESIVKGSDIYQVSKRYGNYRASTT